jgi:predicted porin
MNKKLLAVAVGAALTAPMYAANAAVTVGGQAHLSADYVDTLTNTTTNDQKKVWNISSNVSNIYFKAEEDLGGGLKGIAFLQEYFRFDDNGGATQTSGASGSSATTAYGTRMHDAPAYAGLSSSQFGTVLLGNMDGPVKLTGRSVDLFGNAIGDSRNAAVDNTRFQNAIAYATPNFAGVTVVVAHSTNADNGVVTPTTQTPNGFGTSTNTKQIYGTALGVKYEQGPLMVAGAYMMLDDRLSTATTTYKTTDAYDLAASFKFAGARIVGFYQGVTGAGNVDGADADTYGIGASYTFGANTIKGQWYNFTNKAGATDVSSSVYALGYDYAFSKTFTGYVAIAAASNDLGNKIGMAGGGGHGDTPANYSGGDQNGLSLGMIYNF